MDIYDAMVLVGALLLGLAGWLIHPSLGLGVLGWLLFSAGRGKAVKQQNGPHS